MEVYILDSLLRRTEVVDKFASLIWTERFAEIGDFELDLKSTLANRSLFTPGTRLAINNSYRVMTVETVEDTSDEDGKTILKVKGRSIEAILEDRVAKETLSDTTIEPKWVLFGTPDEIATTMFDHICRDGALDLADVIPFLMPGTFLPDDTVPKSSTSINWEQEPDSLYAAIKAIADLYELGFRLVRNFDTSQLYFDIYSGIDRTTRQTAISPVVFSPDLDNLQNTTEFMTIQQSKNVAYVFSPAGFEIVYGTNVDPDTEGFDRRVLVVNADDITVDNPDVSAALIQRGQQELAKNRAQSYFDGEIGLLASEEEISSVRNLLDDLNPAFATNDLSAWLRTATRNTNPFGVDFSWDFKSKAMKVMATADGFVFVGILSIPVIPGLQYTWSYSIKPEAGSESLITVPVMNWYAADETTLLQQDFPPFETWTDPNPADIYSRQWFTAIAPADVAIVDIFVCLTNAVPGQASLVKDVQLAVGSSTQFAPKQLRKSAYRYGVDYNVGDLVEMRNVDGVVSYKRVTEQIFVCDEQGERSYPTLVEDVFTNENTWLSYANKSTVWLDFDLEPTTWADMD